MKTLRRVPSFMCRCHCGGCALGSHCPACVDWNESQRLPKRAAA